MKQIFLSYFFALSPILRFTVFGNSMTPAYSEGENVLVQKRWFFCTFHIGDSIVCRDPRTNTLLIKRIHEIEKERLFVVGDNEKESTDSRHFGWIEKKNAIGKVISS